MSRLAGIIARVGCAILVLSILSAGPAMGEPVDIPAPGPQGELKGTFLSTGESAPVVLVVPGSGPTDRDGNNPFGVRASTYRLLAEGLAERGVASVRIDKRGMFGSAAAVPDPNAVTIADYAADVHSWVRAIRDKAGVDCVWILGHSEGALVALEAGQKPDGICGLLLVSGPGRKLGDVLRAQLRANPANAPYLPQMLDAIATLEAGGSVDTGSFPPVVAGLFAPAVQAQTRDADPALWVVKDRDTTIYLFGTVHILKPGLSWFDEAVKTAFDRSDQVVLEVVGADDPATMQAAIVRNAIDANGPSVTSQLPEGKRAAYAKALGELGVPAATFDKFKPWFPATMISVGLLPKFGYDPKSGAEQVIAAAAKSAGKPVTALETVDQQFGFFNSLPRESQMVMLERTLDQLPTLADLRDVENIGVQLELPGGEVEQAAAAEGEGEVAASPDETTDAAAEEAELSADAEEGEEVAEDEGDENDAPTLVASPEVDGNDQHAVREPPSE